MARLGLWIDDPVSDVKKTAYWNELKRHGFNTAALMLESTSNGFDAKYTLTDLATISKLALDRDIEIVVTIWPQPTKLYLDELEKELPAYIEASGCAAIEVDVEGNWKSKKVEGFVNLDKAGDRLVAILHTLRDKYDVRIEATTFQGHAENTARADVANHADRLLPQAYSVRNRSEGDIEWNSVQGPGRMQQLTLKSALTVPGNHKLSCGLAAYDQVWPGKKGEEAMQAAYDEAMKYNPEEIRLWSSKWVIGIRKNGYASRWALNLKKGK